MSSALQGGIDGGVPLGIRIAEEAHKKGTPFVVVSGWHGDPGQANFVYAKYLYDKGIIDNPIIPDLGEEAFINTVNNYSYFTASKGSSNEKDIDKLKIIAQVLESKK